jgi:hypothetical protein
MRVSSIDPVALADAKGAMVVGYASLHRQLAAQCEKLVGDFAV